MFKTVFCTILFYNYSMYMYIRGGTEAYLKEGKFENLCNLTKSDKHKKKSH